MERSLTASSRFIERLPKNTRTASHPQTELCDRYLQRFCLVDFSFLLSGKSNSNTYPVTYHSSRKGIPTAGKYSSGVTKILNVPQDAALILPHGPNTKSPISRYTLFCVKSCFHSLVETKPH